ncbi:MAG: CBS domain-containing protein [Polyangiales bacterium]
MVTAGEFCSRTVFIAHPAESLLDAARRMRDEHVGALVVVEEEEDGRHAVGMITDRDILVRSLADDPSHVAALSVGEVMTKQPIRAWEDEPLLDVLKRMRAYGIRRVPVVDQDDHLAGLVSYDDLVEQVADELHDLASLLGRERMREADPGRRVRAHG